MNFATMGRTLAGAGLIWVLGNFATALATPTITGFSYPEPGTYNDNEWGTNHGVIGVSAYFSEKVIVSGAPSIVLRAGSTNFEFPGYLGPNNTSISFRGLPPRGLDGTLVISGPIKLNGGSIKGEDGSDASLSFAPVDVPSVYIDTTHPADPVISGVTPSSPTNDQSFTVTGTSEIGTAVIIAYSSGPTFGSAATDANGNWSITGGPLAPGTYQFVVYAMDKAGNLSRDTGPGIGPQGVSLVITVQSSPTGGWAVTRQPADYVTWPGYPASFSVGTSAANPTYQWQFNGTPVDGATAATLRIDKASPANVGLYTVTVAENGFSATTRPAILGLMADPTSYPQPKIIGPGQEVGTDIVHPNGNIYDQILPHGAAITLKADAGQVARASWVDLSGDIMQAEFSGAGTLSIVLDVPSGPAPAANYNQSGVAYMTGHAGLVITGANATTNVSVFSVGRITAVDQSIFRDDVNYDGTADLAFIAILSSNGKFGGLRAGNGNFWATRGYTGIYAPNVSFTGPVYVGEITATENATPVLLLGSASDVRITGGDLSQTNGQAVQVSGFTQLRFVDGMRSTGLLEPAQTCRAQLVENGNDVTTRVATQ
jgi:hypothetical protein